MKSIVSIERATEINDISYLYSILQTLLKPYSKTINNIKDKVILLKPNLVSAYDYKTGATTNPYLIKALINLILDYSPQKIIIADGSAVGHDTREVFEKLAYYDIFSDLLKDNKVILHDFKKGTYVKKEINKGEEVKKLRIPEILLEVDRIINLPVLKTHDSLPVTLGIKNMKGIIHENAKKKFHRIGLAYAIVDIHKLITPDLTIYDGTVAMEGLGPVHGEPVNLGLILAAEDVVAGDLICSTIMGFSKSELKYLQIAENAGLGVADLERIEIRGLQLLEVKRPFTRYKIDKNLYDEYNISVKDSGSCSGCRHTLDGIMKDKCMLEKLSGSTIYLGPAVEMDTLPENTILLGKCLYKYRKSGYFLDGCPPHPQELKKFISKL